jgi:hypothetical protein
MLRTYFRLLLLLVPTFFSNKMIQAQSRPLELQVRTGWGWGIYQSRYTAEYRFSNSSQTEEDFGAAVCVNTPLVARWELNERWSGGLDLKFGRFLYGVDTMNTTLRENNFTIIGAALEYALVSRPRFRWFVGGGPQFSSLYMKEEYLDNTSVRQASLFMRGGGVRLNSGVIAYFGNWPIGFVFQLGYDAHWFNLRSFSVNYSNVSLQNLTAGLRTLGLDGTIGVVFRVAQKKPFFQFP